MVCTQLLKETRNQTCPTHSHAQQGRQIAERVMAMLKLSKEEKVHVCDLSGSEQPKIMMHQVQGSFRVRIPQKPLVKSVRAEWVLVPTVFFAEGTGELLVAPHRSLLGSVLTWQGKPTTPRNSTGMFGAGKAGSGEIENVDSRNKKNCSVWSLLLRRPWP